MNEVKEPRLRAKRGRIGFDELRVGTRLEKKKP